MNDQENQVQSQEQLTLMTKLEHEGLRFEQWLITLATGTLVLSVTLLTTMKERTESPTLLIASWIALVLSIFFGLIDRLLYIFSISSHPLLARDEEERIERERRWDHTWEWSERMSWLQIVTFFSGVTLLLLFAILELLPPSL